MGKFNEALENTLGSVFKNKLKDCKMSESLMGKSLLFYGDNGTGKTRIASELCDNVIFLSCENGLNATGNGKYININSWSDYLETLDRLENKNLVKLIEQGEELAVVIDGADSLNLYAQRYIASKNGYKNIGDLPHGKGYDLLKKEVSAAMGRFGKLPYLKVQLLHAKETNLEKDMSKPKVFYYDVNLDTRFREASLRDTDLVCFLENVGMDEYGNQKLSTGTFIQTDRNFARCKYLSFPPVIEEITAEKIKGALKKAVKEEMERQGVESHSVIEIMNDQTEEDNRTHNDLISELKEIWCKCEEDEILFGDFSDLIKEQIGDIAISETDSSYDISLKELIRKANKLLQK